MEVAFEYTRKRSEFGKHVVFENGETQLIESILPTDAFDDSYVQQKTVTIGTDTNPPLSTTEVNTERVVYKSTSMQHSEGGFPKEVDPSEPSDVARFRKRVEKSEEFEYAMKLLVPRVEKCLLQNNTVDIYEEYFQDEEINHYSEPPFAMGLAVFRDPSPVTRSATSVNWQVSGSLFTCRHYLYRSTDLYFSMTISFEGTLKGHHPAKLQCHTPCKTSRMSV